MISFIKKLIKKVPPFKNLVEQRDFLLSQIKSYNQAFPPGHFYSPIPDLAEIKKEENKIFNNDKALYGIELNKEEQLDYFNEFAHYCQEDFFKPTKTPGLRFYYENECYSYKDAIVLHGMIRKLKPRRIIEVGSGFSTCVMLDTNQFYFNNQMDIICIEPYPDRLLSLIEEKDLSDIKLYQQPLQDLDLELFKSLDKNDILFIDSTHVAKINSDVNYIIHEILPNLKEQVFIHFHDIFYPFEYPKEWLYEGRAWNEDYILRAFLEFNDRFKIVFFNTYLEHKYPELFHQKMPLATKYFGGSLWIKKIK